MSALRIQRLVTIFVRLDQIVYRAAVEKRWLLRITTRNMMKATVKDFIIPKCLMRWWIFCMLNTMKWTNTTVILLTFTLYRGPLVLIPETAANNSPWLMNFMCTVFVPAALFWSNKLLQTVNMSNFNTKVVYLSSICSIRACLEPLLDNFFLEFRLDSFLVLFLDFGCNILGNISSKLRVSSFSSASTDSRLAS